jgi:hypothetical protein
MDSGLTLKFRVGSGSLMRLPEITNALKMFKQSLPNPKWILFFAQANIFANI